MNINPVHWFLSPPCDTRSSLYLEDAATEFQVQGLELDWTKSHVGRRLTLEWERLELPQFSRGEVDRREEARAAAVSEERLSLRITAPAALLGRYATATRASRVGIGVRRRQTMLRGRLPSWET
ncbi:MAG: DNA/RNA helicase domain-containing protein [Planctomycetota bacterium]